MRWRDDSNIVVQVDKFTLYKVEYSGGLITAKHHTFGRPYENIELSSGQWLYIGWARRRKLLNISLIMGNWMDKYSVLMQADSKNLNQL